LPSSRRAALLAAALLVASAACYLVAIRTPAGPRSLRVFDPDRTAELEVAMWQAYYRKERVRLLALLVTLLHEQNRYPWSKAAVAGYHLARAAAVFGDLRSDYESVLPDLEQAYAIAREWTGSGFDPGAVARAELAWWVARRTPGRNEASEVGALIAEEYARLYEVRPETVAHAAALRAEAAALRDRGGPSPDWPTISGLLHDSYRELRTTLAR
jgi:hypothetical protein